MSHSVIPFMKRTRSALLLGSLVLAGSAFACTSDTPPPANSATLPSRTPAFTFDVVRSYPHDTGAFTQGLQWHENRLFESTGQIGQSSIREVELTSGRVLRKRDLAPPHFGEGIVILGDHMYQITWTTGRAFVYDWRTFRPVREHRYDGQGWGLTTDGTSIIMSNGSSVLVWRDPATFEVRRSLSVTEHGVAVEKLNELEWVDGEIWANVWESDQIARIEPDSGKVVGWIDLSGILPAQERTGVEDVLNGIAYDSVQKRIFVTGKKWPRLFEISLRPK